MWKQFKAKYLASNSLLVFVLASSVMVWGCSKKSEVPPTSSLANESIVFNEEGLGEIKFGMNAQQLEQVSGTPDSRNGNVAIYKNKNLSVITSRKEGRVFEILYGSMSLTGASSIDTNVFNVTFDGITLGSSEESVVSSWGQPQQDSSMDGLDRQVYDRPKSLVTLTYSNNKLILISVRSKSALPKR